MRESRSEFEAWITAPPFERDVTRKPNDPARVAWPGTYESYEIELAWEAWKAGRGEEVTNYLGMSAAFLSMLHGTRTTGTLVRHYKW